MCIYDFLLVCSSITLSRWGSLLFVVLNLQNQIASFISKIFRYSSYLNSVLKILLFIALGELCTKEFKFREATIIKYLLYKKNPTKLHIMIFIQLTTFCTIYWNTLFVYQLYVLPSNLISIGYRPSSLYTL